MASLSGYLISDTYESLLKTSNNLQLESSSIDITDGNGNSTPLHLSTQFVKVAGPLQVTGSVSLLGTTKITGSLTVSANINGNLVGTASLATNAQNAVSASHAISASYLIGQSPTSSYAITSSYAFTASYLNPIESGYVILSQVSSSLNFVDDTAAAAGGVPLGGLYRNGNFIVIRIV